MENLVQPTVFITPEGKNYKPPKNRKPLILVIIAILVIGGLGFAGFYYRNFISKNFQIISNQLSVSKIIAPAIKKDKIQPEVIGKGKISDLPNEGYPVLFYADLEYDPKTGIVTQLKTNLIKSEPRLLFPSPRPSSDTVFIFKVAVSDHRGVWQQGWDFVYKEIALTPKGTINFPVVTFYRSGALVKVYLPDNKLIWTGEIK